MRSFYLFYYPEWWLNRHFTTLRIVERAGRALDEMPSVQLDKPNIPYGI